MGKEEIKNQNSISNESIGEDKILEHALKRWINSHKKEPNEMVDNELSIDEIEKVVSKGLDENYYPNLPKKKYEMVVEDELIEKFKEFKIFLVQKENNSTKRWIFGKLGLTSIINCAEIAKEYSNSKLEELEKWIDEQVKHCESSDKSEDTVTRYWGGKRDGFNLMKIKIKSL